MNVFSSTTEKLEFLKNYNLVPKTASELPVFYYFESQEAAPINCEIIGYEQTYNTWAVIVIEADNKIINIHSDYLLEMKKKGTAYYKNNLVAQSNV